jgi:hypothetical protein
MRIEFFNLDESWMDRYCPVFKEVYESHPWHEQFECSCGKIFAKGCNLISTKAPCSEFYDKVSLIEGDKCKNCGNLLSELKPIWSFENIIADFNQHIRLRDFVARGILVDGEFVGSFSGFALPEENTHHVRYRDIGQLLNAQGIDSLKNFYHYEIMISPKFQKMKLGTKLLKDGLLAIPKNLTTVSYRTINPGTNRCYENVFNKQAVPVFSDPIGEKRQLWYVFNLGEIR